MDIIKLNNVDFAIGLHWKQLNEGSQSRELRQLCKTFETKLGIVNKTMDESMERCQVGLADSSKSKGAVPLAMALARIEDNSILIEEVDGGFWVGAVSESEVLINSDVIVKEKDLKRVFDDIKEMLDETGVLYTCNMSANIASMVECFDFADKSFSDMVSASEYDFEDFEDLAISEVYKDYTKHLLAAFVVVSVAGYAGYAMMQNKISVEDYEALKNVEIIDYDKIAREREEKRVAEEKQAMTDAEAEERIWINDLVYKIDKSEIIRQFISEVRSTNIIEGAWRFMEINWSSLSNERLNKIWHADDSPFASAISLRGSLSGYEEIRIEVDERKAGASHKIVSNAFESSQSAMDAVLDEEHRRELLTNQIILNQFGWEIQERPELRRKRPVELLEDETLKWKWINPVSSYSLSINGIGLGSLEKMSSILDEFPNYALTDLNYVQSNTKWTITGVLYEAKK